MFRLAFLPAGHKPDAEAEDAKDEEERRHRGDHDHQPFHKPDEGVEAVYERIGEPIEERRVGGDGAAVEHKRHFAVFDEAVELVERAFEFLKFDLDVGDLLVDQDHLLERREIVELEQPGELRFQGEDAVGRILIVERNVGADLGVRAQDELVLKRRDERVETFRLDADHIGVQG